VSKAYTCYCDYCVCVGAKRQSLVKWLMRQGRPLQNAKLIACRKHPYTYENCLGPVSATERRKGISAFNHQ